jgi:hypothetical protein
MLIMIKGHSETGIISLASDAFAFFQIPPEKAGKRANPAGVFRGRGNHGNPLFLIEYGTTS